MSSNSEPVLSLILKRLDALEKEVAVLKFKECQCVKSKDDCADDADAPVEISRAASPEGHESPRSRPRLSREEPVKAILRNGRTPPSSDTESDRDTDTNDDKDEDLLDLSESDSDLPRSSSTSSAEGSNQTTVLISSILTSPSKNLTEASNGVQRKVTQSEVVKASICRGNGGPGTRYKCQICKMIFKHGSSLVRHIFNVHSPVKQFKCTHCPKQFSRKDYLRSHEETHGAVGKYFECGEGNCGRRYKRKSALNRHVQIVHENKRPYVCDFCDQGFGQKTSLVAHVQTHSMKKRSY